MGAVFDIVDYGACPDGRTLSTAGIQKAIDACHQAGGGRVLCGVGRFVTGSLTLRSNVELHLALGCVLAGSTHLEDYQDFVAEGFLAANAPEGCTQGLIRAVNAANVAITGPGEVNGSGLAFYETATTGSRFFKKPDTPRPRIVMFYRCQNIRLEDASFVDSPCWTMWLMQCERVGIHRVKIAGDRRMVNHDGIDVDACRDVVISDCIIRTGDDCLILRAIQQVYETPAVCENVAVSNCVLDSRCNGIRVGCPGDNIIRNCTFGNLVIHSEVNGILFENPRRYLPPDGRASADVHQILFSNIVVECANAPIKVVIEDGIALPRLAGLSFTDFRIRSGGPCQIEGSPESTIRDVSFNNVEIESSAREAVVLRYCEGIAFNHVRLSNRP